MIERPLIRALFTRYVLLVSVAAVLKSGLSFGLFKTFCLKKYLANFSLFLRNFSLSYAWVFFIGSCGPNIEYGGLFIGLFLP